MCGRFALFSLDPEFFAGLGVTALPSGLAPRWNIAPGQRAAVVLEEGGQRRLRLLRWGLVPHWAREEKIGDRLINARVETLAEKPAFRDSLHRRRCLVPADGFYEWQKAGGRKQPFFVGAADGRPLALAGLWDSWERAGDGPLETFTIVTAPAGPALAEIHGRMPLVLPAEVGRSWLAAAPGREELAGLVDASRQTPLQVRPVSTLVNNPAHDGPELLQAPS